MSRELLCKKLNKHSAGLMKPPIPGPLGERIYAEISQEAWTLWLNHQTMLINEYRLSMIDPNARNFLLKEMENYFFGEGSEKPAGFVEQTK